MALTDSEIILPKSTGTFKAETELDTVTQRHTGKTIVKNMPDDLATGAKQDTTNSALADLNAAIGVLQGLIDPGTAIDGQTLATGEGEIGWLSTIALLLTARLPITSSRLVVDASGTTITATIAGVATAAAQTTGNVSLNSIDTKTPALEGTRRPVTVRPSIPSRNLSGTVITGGSAQNITPTATGLVPILVQNHAAATESLWVNIGTAATTAFPSIELVAGDSVQVVIDTATQSLSVIAATTAHKFYALEG